MSEAYFIKLPQFEGPFDLLLFFIERDELDIYNIPINQITKDFLAFIHQMETLNIEMASEFILFISTLMRIKAKMLLPRRELDASGNEIDPRQELVNKLLEYKRFKEASEQMAALEAERLLRQKRGNIKQELDALGHQHAEGTEIQTVTLYKLVNTFERVMKRFLERHNKPQHVIVKYNYSMESQRAYLSEYLLQSEKSSFEELFSQMNDRIQAIFTFLALLEMVQQKMINLLVGEGRNNFIFERNDEGGTPEIILPEATEM
ncbi:segregation and condensation protein A [Edaphocola aurantiacus]|uniref:segregation and condensation protein A n=1 Tax=Edaphocola aurantiacus TaxID=2601682 RepID=UPI001C9513A6|nr:segregation/condensation protein A [Edaphocola aurantiacus]